MLGKKVGVIVEVNGNLSKVGVYNLLNDSDIIWNGELLSGIKVGAYLTINQNDIKIIAKVSSERVVDQQNTVNSEEFDNRFHKNSINKIIELKTKGVIENNKFKITNKYVPMIGNEITLTTNKELNLIYGIDDNEETITIGNTILEGYPVKISINKFYASHIGIFGNTGSGKSNTLHKLYLELLKSNYKESIKVKSRFFVIDFNGEYCTKNIFGLTDEERKIIDINTRINNSEEKIIIKPKYFFDIDILSMLFDARVATQVPFLKKATNKFLEINSSEEFANLEMGLLDRIVCLIKGSSNLDILENWINVVSKYVKDEDILKPIKEISSHIDFGNSELKTKDGKIIIVKDAMMTEKGKNYIKYEEIKKKISDIFLGLNKINQFLMFLEFQRVYEIFYNITKADFINPLFSRIRQAIESLDKVIEVRDELEENSYKMMTIISLVNANSQIKRLIPMLFSKMIYDEHKGDVSKNGIKETKHLIIDEAHNILNSQYKNIGDDWQDYRLSIFEEIIKEGRKFGFYLTLASQRPADISPTIMSQLHNYFIHRIVNDKDLQMLENTMPTLDIITYNNIPLLGQGEAIITGNSFKIPVLAKIEKEENNRPNSDDIILTELWS